MTLHFRYTVMHENNITIIVGCLTLMTVIICVTLWTRWACTSGKYHINPFDLITDSKGKLEYKKLAMNTVALCYVFTWLRMSMGYEVNPALQTATMWFVFYGVVAAQALIEMGMINFIKYKFGPESKDKPDTLTQGLTEPPK